MNSFWTSTTMHGDPLCFIDRGTGRTTAALLFPPDGVVSMRSAAGDVEYAEGIEFVLDGAPGIGRVETDPRDRRNQR